jgi:hypothetical protein
MSEFQWKIYEMDKCVFSRQEAKNVFFLRRCGLRNYISARFISGTSGSIP